MCAVMQAMGEPLQVVSGSVRFFYPVRVADVVLIYYAYEDEKVQGVDIHYEDDQPVLFRRMRDATRYCDVLNTQQAGLPAYLPSTALNFLLRYRQHAKIVVKHQQRFLVLPMGAVS